MKNTVKWIGLIAITAVLAIFSLTACVIEINTGTKENETGKTGTSIEPVAKYVAVSDTPVQNGARTANDDFIKKIRYMYTFGDQKHYLIYLGEMTNIPLYSFPAVRNDGMLEGPVTFKITNTEEETISETISRSSQTAIGHVDTHTFSHNYGQKLSSEISAKATAGLDIKVLKVGAEVGVKTAAELSFGQNVSDTRTSSFQITTSVLETKTVGARKANSMEMSQTYNFTKDSKRGWYRYTLFSVSDIYLYVIKDDTGVVFYEYREYVKPDGFSGWVLDYAAESEDYTRKTDSSGFLLDIDVSNLGNLLPDEIDDRYDLSPVVSFNLNGGSGSIPPSMKGLKIDLPNGDGFSKSGVRFTSWNTRADGTGTAYADGSSFDVPEPYTNVVLYAEWKGPEKVSIRWDIGEVKNTAKNLRGDNELASNRGILYWSLKVELKLIEPNDDGTFKKVQAHFIYEVREKEKDYTHLQMESDRYYEGHNIIRLLADPLVEQKQGEINRDTHAYEWVVNNGWNGILRQLEVKIDGPGTDLNNIGIKPVLQLEFETW